MTKLPKRLCPICLRREVEVLHIAKFLLPLGHPLADGYEVVTCLQCGFVYADSQVAQADYDYFYANYSKYEDAKTGTGGVENPFDWKRQQQTAAQVTRFLSSCGSRILDIGCANGGLLQALSDLGYNNLCGVDPSPICVVNTRRLGIEAHVGSLFQPFDNGLFDCIILSHTLEHILDLRESIKWVGERLNSGGVIYLETPDAARYVDFIYAPFQEFNTEHINHFSSLCLRNLMSQFNFSQLEGGPKTLFSGPEVFYPAIFGFWGKDKEKQPSLVKDEHLGKSISAYIQASMQIQNKINLRLEEVLSVSPSVIVWGIGQMAIKLLADSPLAHADILAFVDNNPIHEGKLLRGIPIIRPDKLQNRKAPIVIATLLHHRSIAEQISQMGLENRLIFLN